MSKDYMYILSNIGRTALYIGVTSNLNQRIWDHKEGKGSKFTKKYKLTILLYAEEFDSISDAIARKKQLTTWRRNWKWELIKTNNPLVDGLVSFAKKLA